MAASEEAAQMVRNRGGSRKQAHNPCTDSCFV